MVLYELERSKSPRYLYHQSDVNLNFPVHVHNSFEFITVTEGELLLTLEDRTFSLKSGQAALILPNLVHSYATPVFSKSDLCVFSAQFIGSFYEQTKDKTSDCPVFDFDRPDILKDLRAEGQNHFLLKSHFYYIAHLFDRNAHYEQRDKRYSDFTPKIIAYIEEHFTEKIDMHSLAAELGYDYNYLSNLINDRLHIHFLALVNEYRINHAQYLLTSTDDSVTSVSMNCGYDSIRSFNRNFQARTGMTPTEYRNRKP